MIQSVLNVYQISPTKHLQQNLNTLSSWSLDNISFDLDKTVFLGLPVTSNPIPTTYRLDNHTLIPVESRCDLGVIVSNKQFQSTQN